MKSFHAISMLLVLACCAGCPQTPPDPRPEGAVAPFDARGTYQGTWSANGDQNQADITNCTITITITSHAMNPSQPEGEEARDLISGTVAIDGACLTLSQSAVLSTSTMNVAGWVTQSGQIQVQSTGTSTGVAPTSILLGPGADTTSDKRLDSFTGNIGLNVANYSTQPPTFINSWSGSFSTARQ